MKKIIYLVLIIFTLFISTNVSALNKKVLTLDATEKNGAIEVSGTTESGCTAVAIMVYEEDGTTLVTVQSTQVNDDKTFKDSIEVDNGNYIVKVADYDGGDFVTKEVSITTNPSTGDNVLLYVAIIIVGIIGASLSTMFIVKRKLQKAN